MLHAYPSKAVLPEIHPVESLRDTKLFEVWSAWLLIKKNSELPTAPQDILRHVPRHINGFHLSEVIDDGEDFRFRIIGENVFPDLQDNQTGRLVSEHPDPGIALRFTLLMRATRAARKPIRGISARLTEHAERNCLIESLWLPFGTTSVQNILGISVFERPKARR